MFTQHNRLISGFAELQYGSPLAAATGAMPTNTEGRTQPGVVFITYNGGAGAYTIGAPVSGAPLPPAGSAATLGVTGPTGGGDDGMLLRIVTTTSQSHVITGPAACFNGNKNTITFANAGDSALIQAKGGVWYVVGGNGTLGGA